MCRWLPCLHVSMLWTCNLSRMYPTSHTVTVKDSSQKGNPERKKGNKTGGLDKSHSSEQKPGPADKRCFTLLISTCLPEQSTTIRGWSAVFSCSLPAIMFPVAILLWNHPTDSIKKKKKPDILKVVYLHNTFRLTSDLTCFFLLFREHVRATHLQLCKYLLTSLYWDLMPDTPACSWGAGRSPLSWGRCLGPSPVRCDTRRTCWHLEQPGPAAGAEAAVADHQMKVPGEGSSWRQLVKMMEEQMIKVQ